MTFKSLACTIASCAMFCVPATAADYIRPAPSGGVYATSSVCGTHAVLSSIDHRFGYRAGHYLHSGLAVVDFHGAHELAREPAQGLHKIGRTYCEATVVTSDNRSRPVWYLIETTMGFAGIGDNIEYCVGGLDPWYVYGAHCASVRP